MRINRAEDMIVLPCRANRSIFLRRRTRFASRIGDREGREERKQRFAAFLHTRSATQKCSLVSVALIDWHNVEMTIALTRWMRIEQRQALHFWCSYPMCLLATVLATGEGMSASSNRCSVSPSIETQRGMENACPEKVDDVRKLGPREYLALSLLFSKRKKKIDFICFSRVQQKISSSFDVCVCAREWETSMRIDPCHLILSGWMITLPR